MKAIFSFLALCIIGIHAISVPSFNPSVSKRGPSLNRHDTTELCFAPSVSSFQQRRTGAQSFSCRSFHPRCQQRRLGLRMQKMPQTEQTEEQSVQQIPDFETPQDQGAFFGSRELNVMGASMVLGVMSGCGVVAFKNGIAAMRELTFEGPYADFLNKASLKVYSMGLFKNSDINIEYLFLPLVGGVVTAILLKLIDRKDFGPPLPGQLEQVDKGVAPDVKMLLTRQVAAVSALGAGASLGPEGPSVEIGVSASRILANALGYGHELRRVMASAGAAAGVSAGFDAPLSGVMFALELIQPSVAPDREDKDSALAFRATAGAILTSSAVACVIARYLIMGEDKFIVTRYELVDPFLEIPIYMSLGVLSGVVAATFRATVANMRKLYGGQIKAFRFMKKVPAEVKPLMATGICGLVAVKYPQTMFFGYNAVNSLLSEKAAYKDSIPDLLTLMSLKIGLTSSCMASGLMGGNFAPALFFGASLGAAYQQLLQGIPAFEIAGTSNYAMVGAAAMLGAIFRAPITGILLLFELTRDYDIVLPLIASVGFATVTIDLIEGDQTTPTWAWWWQPNPLAPAQVPAASALRLSLTEMAIRAGGDASRVAEVMDAVEVAGSVRIKQVLALAEDLGLQEEAAEVVSGMREQGSAKGLEGELASVEAMAVLQVMLERQAASADAVPAPVD